jgi:ABC-type glycerol-3-phosphate transport system permease component
VFFFPNLIGGRRGGAAVDAPVHAAGRLVNAALAGIGLSSFNAFAWLSPDHMYWALIPMSIWGACGFNMVLYLAAMENVPESLYESATIDGATPWRQFWSITVPLIWEVLAISIVFMVIGGMKAFDLIWLLTNQQPTTRRTRISTRMVQTMFCEYKVGEATAIAVLLFFMVFLGTAATLRVMRRETGGDVIDDAGAGRASNRVALRRRVCVCAPQRPRASPLSSASRSSTCCCELLSRSLSTRCSGLFYTSLKPDRDIFLHPFSLPTRQTFSGRTTAMPGPRAASTVTSPTASSSPRRPCRHDVPRRDGGVRAVAIHLPGAKAIYFLLPRRADDSAATGDRAAVLPDARHGAVLDNRFGLFLVYLAFRLPVLDLRADRLLPLAPREPARIRPARRRRRVRRILARDAPAGPPGLVTVGIFLFLGNWNEFFVAFVTLSGKDSEASARCRWDWRT